MPETEIEIEAQPPSVKVQFTKLLLATAAGFAANKLTERAVDAFIEHRRKTSG